MTEVDLANAVEALIDSTSAVRVLDAFAAACFAKAEHIQASYGEQDTTAIVWEELGHALAKIEDNGI